MPRRPYPFAALLLACSLVLMGAGPLVQHVCRAHAPAAVERAGHAMPCCAGHQMAPCPQHDAAAGVAMTLSVVPCCLPALPAPAVTPAPEPAPRGAATPVLQVATLVFAPLPPPARRPDPSASPPHVRPHLTFSVLLI